jgi:hypothetical protein
MHPHLSIEPQVGILGGDSKGASREFSTTAPSCWDNDSVAGGEMPVSE